MIIVALIIVADVIMSWRQVFPQINNSGVSLTAPSMNISSSMMLLTCENIETMFQCYLLKITR